MIPTQAGFTGLSEPEETPLFMAYNEALALSDDLYGIALEQLEPLNDEVEAMRDAVARLVKADGDINKALGDAAAEREKGLPTDNRCNLRTFGYLLDYQRKMAVLEESKQPVPMRASE